MPPQPPVRSKPEDKTTKAQPVVTIEGDESQYTLVEPLGCIDQYIEGNIQLFYTAKLKRIK